MSSETKTEIPDLFCKATLSDSLPTTVSESWSMLVWHVVAAYERRARFHHLKLSEMQMWRQSLFPVPLHVDHPSQWKEQKRTCVCSYADEDDKSQQVRIDAALQYADKSPKAMAKLQAARANIRKIEQQYLQRVHKEDVDRYPMAAIDYRDHALRANVERVPIQIMSEHGGIDWERMVPLEHETIFRGVMLFVPVLYTRLGPDGVPEATATFNLDTIACYPMPARKQEEWKEWVLRSRMQEKDFRIEQVIEL